jgi:serine/threonine-protein kinase
MADTRTVQAAPPTPAPSGTGTGRTVSRLPEELLSEQVQRLAVFAAVVGAVWTVGLFMDFAVLPAATGQPQNWRSLALEFMGAFTAALMCLYASTSPASPQHKMDVGLGFMLLNAFGVAMLNTWAATMVPDPSRHLSWLTVLILVYAMIAPSAPRRMLVASLAAASMDPLGYWLASLRGDPAPSLANALPLIWPAYACAVIAVVPSRVLQRIGRRLHEAQEMGSYHLVELLGTGGMGEVWRAGHRLLARDAAIKLVRPEVLGARTDAEARVVLRRFEREAQATAALSSPHSIQLFDFGTTRDGSFYYVMELLMGRDLESLVREFGPVPATRALFLLRQVCHSLADAHARGLVHRDIKPANIYVCRMGLDYDFVKVLDFGLVKMNGVPKTGETLATLDHTTTGTPAYMAPETILGDVDVDRRADVYALGCLAYFVLTGQLVFDADTPMRMLLQHLNTKPVPPSQRTELAIPRELDELVLQCLEKDPDRRPQDAGELFRLACGCHACDGWTQEMAERWWSVHLPEYTGPLAPIARRESAAEMAAAGGASAAATMRGGVR